MFTAQSVERSSKSSLSFTPQIEPLSIDEAFLDVSGSLKLLGPAEEIARTIRHRIATELSLPASAGIAPNKFVAKLASGLAKPNGQLMVEEDELQAFLAPQPIRRMWGVGKKSLPQFEELGLKTFGDLARQSDAHLLTWFGERGPWWAKLARGEDAREVETERESKSLGAEQTFESDSDDLTFFGARTLTLCREGWASIVRCRSSWSRCDL